MRIGLLLPSNIWFCPYASIYTNILKDNNIDFDIISWNRDGSEKAGDCVFDLQAISLNRLGKFSSFFKYIRYIKKITSERKYDKLIVFGPQLAILLYPFLKKKYNKKFILDFRDLSIEQLPVINKMFKKVVDISSLCAISSLGFIKYLPQSTFLLSHNFDFNEKLKDCIQTKEDSEVIKVLTIGSIRNYDSNLEVIKALGNKVNINLYFVGKGVASNDLEKYVKENNINNVFFKGFYQKGEEKKIIENCTILNIYFPNIKSHSSIMSNRFYHGIAFKKPMIVTSNSIQGDYVEKYDLGLSINNCDNLYELLINYNKNFDSNKFEINSNKLLSIFREDYTKFHQNILKFLEIEN